MPRSENSWETWTDANKLKLLGQLRARQWRRTANPGQLPPDGRWKVWWARGGRGAGKTRTGAETLAQWILAQPATPDDPMPEWGVIAPTRGQARSICVEGESGLLRALGPAVENWNRSDGELWVRNGAVVRIDGSDYGGERIEGKNLRGAWADEIGKWKKPQQAWEEALWFAVRMGLNPRIIATGTPKGKQGIVKLLLESPSGVVMTHLRVQDNRGNLAPGIYEQNVAKYGGTRLGRQEIEGEIISDVQGALWRLVTIERLRLRSELVEERMREIEVLRTVVAIDPAASSGEDADETGIVAASLFHPDDARARDFGMDRAPDQPQGLVLADASGRYTPTEWATEAIRLYHELRADRIVAEKNNGGEMVEAVLRQVDPSVPVTLVWASKGKQTRAEPVSALYEQNRVHHLDALPELESEMTSWVPGDASPNRMDALVWAITDLMLDSGDSEIAAAPITAGETITGDLLSAQW